MSEEDEIISHFLSLQPSQFHQLDRFEVICPVVSTDPPPTHQLQLVLRPDISTAYPQLTLTFFGVAQLRFDTTAFGEYGELQYLAVRSIRERRWEGLHYRVQDDEERLTFFCDTFEAEKRETPPQGEATP